MSLSSKKRTVVACVVTCIVTGILTAGTLLYLGGRDGFDYKKFQQVKDIIDNEFIYEHDGKRMTDYAISLSLIHILPICSTESRRLSPAVRDSVLLWDVLSYVNPAYS